MFNEYTVDVKVCGYYNPNFVFDVVTLTSNGQTKVWSWWEWGNDTISSVRFRSNSQGC